MSANDIELNEELLEIMKLPGAVIGEKSKSVWKSDMKICLIISDDYGEKILGNLNNSIGHCSVCSSKCIGELCKYGKYNFSQNISIVRVPNVYELPKVIDEPEKFLENRVPKVDLVIATSIHNDFYLSLPEILHDLGIKGFLIFRSSPFDAPLGVLRQIEEKCNEYNIEFDAPKPPCLLKPSRNKPIIMRFIREFRIGFPLISLKTIDLGNKVIKIDKIEIKISAPCGATWYAARMMLNYKINLKDDKSIREMCRYVAALHQAYCIASTAHDYELGDTVIHWATYIGIESYLRALNLRKELEKYVKERIRKKII